MKEIFKAVLTVSCELGCSMLAELIKFPFLCGCRPGLLNGKGQYYRRIPDDIVLQPQHNLNQVPLTQRNILCMSKKRFGSLFAVLNFQLTGTVTPVSCTASDPPGGSNSPVLCVSSSDVSHWFRWHLPSPRPAAENLLLLVRQPHSLCTRPPAASAQPQLLAVAHHPSLAHPPGPVGESLALVRTHQPFGQSFCLFVNPPGQKFALFCFRNWSESSSN